MIADREITRRSFLKTIGGAGACFALGSFTSIGCSPGKAMASTQEGPFVPNGYVSLAPDGSVTITVYRSEMGQGVRTSMAMCLAEELDVPWTSVKILQAPGASGPVIGEGTGGSSSTRTSFLHLRQMGAGARSMLVATAAKNWGVDPSGCTTAEGKVLHSSGRTAAYTELLQAAADTPAPDLRALKLKAQSDFKILGKPTKRIDGPAIVTGQAKYGIDMKVPGMKYAVLARPQTIGGNVKSFDDRAARAIEGVLDVKQTDDGVAVFATNTWAAIKGRDALKIEWNDGPNTALSTESIRHDLVGQLIPQDPPPSGSKTVKATLDFPYLAHACMEPMNALADVREGHCTVWSGTQSPESAQNAASVISGVPKPQVAVNVPLLGGGFGRRGNADFVIEAVKLSKLANAPVKLMWTREDDIRNDDYRPMSHHEFVGAVDGSGNAVFWRHQAVLAWRGGPVRDAGKGLAYDIADAHMFLGGVQTPVRAGAWRSVEHTQLDAANECFIDELAHAAGQDPFEFRRKLIKDAKLKLVIETAAEKSGWGKPLPPGSGRGIACFLGYGSAAAHVAEVTVVGNQIKVDRMVAVVDVGFAVNPQGVEAQLQGACTDGLSTALRAAITIEKGKVVQGSWDTYNWMTQDAMPKVETYVLQSGGDPGGMGETGYPSVSPAIANAVFAATGKRVRRFPIKIEELA